MIVEIPELNKIKKPDWFTKQKYNTLQKVEIKQLINDEVWVTAERKQIRVKDMTTSHINNCINCLHGKGYSIIPDGYLGGKDKWLKIFNQELINRQ